MRVTTRASRFVCRHDAARKRKARGKSAVITESSRRPASEAIPPIAFSSVAHSNLSRLWARWESGWSKCAAIGDFLARVPVPPVSLCLRSNTHTQAEGNVACGDYTVGRCEKYYPLISEVRASARNAAVSLRQEINDCCGGPVGFSTVSVEIISCAKGRSSTKRK